MSLLYKRCKGWVESPNRGRRVHRLAGCLRLRVGRFPGPRPAHRLAGIPPPVGRSIRRTATAAAAGGDFAASRPVDSPNRGRRTRPWGFHRANRGLAESRVMRPSCDARRMATVVAHVTDHVPSHLPIPVPEQARVLVVLWTGELQGGGPRPSDTWMSLTTVALFLCGSPTDTRTV
jgi:hypothetical protein